MNIHILMRKSYIRYWSFLILLLLLPFSSARAITLVRVGYLDLDDVIQTYTVRYLETQIQLRERYVNQLNEEYSRLYFTLNIEEKKNLQVKIQDHKDVLKTFNYNLRLFETNGTIQDDIIQQILQIDIMEAIQKTSELEGFHLILDKTGNFIYGSEDINLTDRVLFRLEEKLLNMQNSDYVPQAPLSYELEESLNVQ